MNTVRPLMPRTAIVYVLEDSWEETEIASYPSPPGTDSEEARLAAVEHARELHYAHTPRAPRYLVSRRHRVAIEQGRGGFVA